MSQNEITSSKIEDHSDQKDENEFVPRFVKVFNESRTHEPRLPQLTSAQSVDLYQKRMTDNSIMKTSPKHRDIKTTSKPYLEGKPLDEQRKSWKDGASFSIDKSAFCKRTAMQMSLDSERRKKIVRTNTDSEILIPKVSEAEDPFEPSSIEEVSSPIKSSIENLKERLKEGKMNLSIFSLFFSSQAMVAIFYFNIFPFKRLINFQQINFIKLFNLLTKGSRSNNMNEKGKVRFEEPMFQDVGKKKQSITRQKSLSRAMSTSALRIRKRRSFWSKETLKIGE